MRVRARTEYALQVVMYLAVADSLTISAKRISDSQRIPARFLEQIIAQLRRAGVLHSRRGVHGGYRLAVQPDELSVAAVVNAVDLDEDQRRPRATRVSDATLETLWRALDGEIEDFLDGVTIADLVAGELPAWTLQRARSSTRAIGTPGR